MLITVHSHEKPANYRRAVIAAILLLALATALAASFTSHQAGGRGRLSSVIAPDRWSISFRPPEGSRGGRLRMSVGDRFQLQFPTPSGSAAILDIHRLGDAAATDLETAGMSVMQSYGSRSPELPTAVPLTWHDKRLGTHTAVEVWDPSLGMLVRTARVRSGEIYAVVMGVPLSAIDPGAYEVFTQFCRSIADRPR